MARGKLLRRPNEGGDTMPPPKGLIYQLKACTACCTKNQESHSDHFPHAPATCLVLTFRRLKRFVVAIERIRAASAGSS